jgi:hypothetical protein
MMVLKRSINVTLAFAIPVTDQIFRKKCVSAGNYSAVALTMACFPL